MNKVFEIIDELLATSSSNDKLAILKKYKDEKDFLKVMQFLYSPYIKSNIGYKKLNANEVPITFDANTKLTWSMVISEFSNSTGTQAELTFAWACINELPMGWDKTMAAIITKTLTIGITATTLNKAYGKGFIQKGGCMLGTLQKDVIAKYNQGNFIVTEKFDGQRKLNVRTANDDEIYSGRNWMYDPLYPDVVACYTGLPNGYVYDGEMLAVGEFPNSLARRQATSSICSKKGPKEGVEHVIFDIIPLADFKTGVCNVPTIIRKFWVAVLFDDKESIDILESLANFIGIKLYVPNEFNNLRLRTPRKYLRAAPVLGYLLDNITEEGILNYVTPIWQRGDEGIMLNEAAAPYEVKRSKYLLKVKNTEEYDLRITGWEYGTVETANEFVCGSLILNYKGFEVSAGSGLSREQRIDIMNNPEEWIGKICTVQCFGESKNKKGGTSLNSPVFICLRDDKEEADFE